MTTIYRDRRRTMNLPPQPDDAQYVERGTYYKLGIHGLPFLWTGLDWVRSTRPKEEIAGLEKVNND